MIFHKKESYKCRHVRNCGENEFPDDLHSAAVEGRTNTPCRTPISNKMYAVTAIALFNTTRCTYIEI